MLIIGGSGFVGNKLIHYAKPNYEIHATFNTNRFESDQVSISQLDLLGDRTAIIRLIENLNPDFVINTAALSSVDLCQSNPKLADVLHVDVTRDIMETCKKFNSKLIHFSTDAVFDGKLDRKYTEKDIPNPINHYGKTRLIAEDIVLNGYEQNVILRSAVIYGWNKKSRFTNWILQTLMENKMVDPHIDQFNTPTLVDDLAKVILRIIEENVSGLFHAVGRTCISRYDFALNLADRFCLDKTLIRPVTSIEKRQDAPRPPKTCLDVQKLEKLIDFKFCDIKTGISFIFNEYLRSK